MNRKFVVADTHYGHNNIVRGVSQWENPNATRDFESVLEMNDAIVKSINDKVTKHDELYLIGDVAFGNVYTLVEFISRLKCGNIHVILGNHDQSIRDNRPFTIDHITETLHPLIAIEKFGKTILPNESEQFRTHDMFKTVSHRKTIKHEGQSFVLDHYPLEAWNGSTRGTVMLHGHVHQALNDSILNTEYRRFDMDWGYWQRPVEISELFKLAAKRKKLNI